MIDWTILAWPASGWSLGALVAALAAMTALRRRVRLFAWLGGRVSALCSIGCALAVTVALGLVPQSRGEDGGWWRHLASSWPFVIAWAWLVVSLGLATARVAVERRWTLRKCAFMLNHLGLWLALVAATLGAADQQRLRMAVGQQRLGAEPQSVAWDAKGEPHRLDFDVALLDFKITPKNFEATVSVDGKSPQAIEVNRPAKAHGWQVYLISYEADLGEDTRYCELELVRDPWLPAVYVGIVMMLAGAAALLAAGKWKIENGKLKINSSSAAFACEGTPNA